MSNKRSKSSRIAELLQGFRAVFAFVFCLSGLVNILALTGAFYMLQIYDRVLSSGSVPTLAALSLLAIGLYLFHGILDVLRSQILVRLGAKFDHKLSPLAHSVAIDMPRYGYSTAEASERSRDVDTIRQFLSSQGPIALFDLPWMPFYIVFVYFLHPWLGIMTLGGAIILSILTLITELLTKKDNSSVQQASINRATIAESHTRNADVLRAMGYSDRAVRKFEDANNEHLQLQMRTSDISSTFSGFSKILRMILQSSILGLGAYFAILGELTPGAIIAASIIGARALAPVDLAIAHWKSIAVARRSFARLKETLSALPEKSDSLQLPAPVSNIELERVTIAAPGSGTVIASDINFELNAGQALGLIGPSGSGKSSIAKAITNVWPVARGSVRLDGAEHDQWLPSEYGNNIGYLPQDVSLLFGTVAENICRFDENPDDGLIVRAAKSARVHELIVRLPNGYQTELGPNGTDLSAGQRQRIALARALYRDPFLVVLDEPNSNLDVEGEDALTAAIMEVRQRQGIVIVIAHRPSALTAVDMIGIVNDGKLVKFGSKQDIAQPSKETRLGVGS